MTCLLGVALWIVVGAIVGVAVGRHLREKER
jgi:hypothetical protein